MIIVYTDDVQFFRQTWNKYNLFNLSRIFTPSAATKTFYQQKWAAKAMTRGYHHPQLKEKHWSRMFDRRLPAVVPMDYRYLAKHDGSEMAQGRGSGLDVRPDEEEEEMQRTRAKTPYMHMTYHTLERRLDTAVFRALFASSTKQARQFVVHGGVKVNGKKMVYPGYKLNPGDMFSVEPDLVLYATGAKKHRKDGPISAQDRAAMRAAARDGKEARSSAAEDELDDGSDAGAATLESDEEREAMATNLESEEDPKKALKSLLTRASRILDDSKRKLSGKRTQELREFSRSVKKTLSRLRGVEEGEMEETIGSFETGLAEILTKIPRDAKPGESIPEDGSAMGTLAAAQQHDAATEARSAASSPGFNANQARKDAELLHAALERARENPRDSSKPYATPWQPREFMSAFAFIPRYLEVNQNVCSAVYLRHPVARPGLAEVPTPFHGETMGLAFNYYLRRR